MKAHLRSFALLASLSLIALHASLGCSASPPSIDKVDTDETVPADDGSNASQNKNRDASVSTDGASSDGDRSPTECAANLPRHEPVVVYPLPDSTSAPFVATVNRAQKTLRVMVYQMGFGPILDAIVVKATAGIDVRVILDVSQKSTNQKYFDKLTAAGAKVKWSREVFTYMHAKVILADDAEVMIATANYSESYLAKERNYAAKDTDSNDVASATAIFDADWNETDPDLACTRLVVSPVNSRESLLGLIKGANHSLEIESMQFADKAIAEAVLAQKAKGVDVRVILADPSWIDANAAAGETLKAAGIDVRYLKSPGVHAKAIVADDARAYVGSENLSFTSLSKNREVGVIVDEKANIDRMHQTFATDFANATSF